MKRILLGLVALGAIASVAGTARAQDWHEWHDWSGPYIGLQAGYEWGTSKGDPMTDPDHDNPVPFNFTHDGVVGGIHGGYNFQFGQIVLGVEADAEGAGVSGKEGVTSNQGGLLTAIPYTFKTTMDFDASVRGRLGFAFSRFLAYGTGGVAFGDVRTSYSCPTCLGAGGNFYNLSGFRTGWTAGGGLEYAVDRHWGLSLEYRYMDLGTKSYSDPGVNSTDHNAFTSNAVRLGVTFHFPPPVMMAAAAPPPPPAPMPAAPPAPAPVPQARTFIVFFDFDKYNLTPDARKVVEEAANAYKAGGSPKVTLAGYTDLSGSVPYNLRLSERRAKTVAAAMSKMGVPASAMDVSWHGKENPRVPTPDGVREPQNRRVEISE